MRSEAGETDELMPGAAGGASCLRAASNDLARRIGDARPLLAELCLRSSGRARRLRELDFRHYDQERPEPRGGTNRIHEALLRTARPGVLDLV